MGNGIHVLPLHRRTGRFRSAAPRSEGGTASTRPRLRLTLAPATQSPAEYWGSRLLILILAAWSVALLTGFRSGLALLNLGAFVAAVAGIRRPALGLLGVSMLCTLDSITGPLLMTGGLLRWNTLNYWLVLVMAVHLPLILRLSDPHSLLLKGLIAVLGLGLIFSPDLERGIQHLLGIVASFGVLTYFIRAEREEAIW